MSPKNTPSYDRAPSLALQKLLSVGGFLAPLPALASRQVAGCNLDVHLRRNDEVHIYCGLTRLVKVKLCKNGTIRIGADKSYTQQQCGRALFRGWNTTDSSFGQVLDSYLRSVKVDGRRTKKEGFIQAHWSRIVEPWIPFDKEAELSYASKEDRKDYHCKAFFPSVKEAHDELNVIARSCGWSLPPNIKADARLKLDQLAVDPEGRLVIVELKHASAVYYAPLQLVQYVWEWYGAFKSVRDQLQALIDARKRSCLTPTSAPDLDGGIRAAVCFGADNRSPEVKSRYAEVLDVINTYLPADVPPIETWALDGRTPVRL